MVPSYTQSTTAVKTGTTKQHRTRERILKIRAGYGFFRRISALGPGEDARCTDRPKRAIRCGGDPVQAIIGILGVRTRNKIPVRAIPVFCQSELGTALERDNILTRSPNVVTRSRDDAHQDLIGSVGIENRSRDDAPACAIPMDRQ